MTAWVILIGGLALFLLYQGAKVQRRYRNWRISEYRYRTAWREYRNSKRR